jgi:curved DNA-binding protein
MDYYNILGVNRNASQDEIKSAYRKMAMKYHPDRGGDEKKFKEVEEAYRTLSDPQKKQVFDMGGDPNNQNGGFYNQGPFEFHFGTGNMNDIFGNFGFGGPFGFGNRNVQRNKSINIAVEITLEEVLQGKDIDAELAIPGGKKKIINISIPPGIEDNQQIRYQGMGDNSIPHMPPGDLLVNIRVLPHIEFRREGSNIVVDKIVSVWDAILGCSLSIKTLDNKTLQISVPPGTQPETVLSCKNEGLPLMRTQRRGNLLIKIKVEIPKNINQQTKSTIEKLKNNDI